MSHSQCVPREGEAEATRPHKALERVSVLAQPTEKTPAPSAMQRALVEDRRERVIVMVCSWCS